MTIEALWNTDSRKTTFVTRLGLKGGRPMVKVDEESPAFLKREMRNPFLSGESVLNSFAFLTICDKVSK